MSRLFSSIGFNSNFPTRIPNILIWKSYPTTSFPHSGWTESKINKSDTRLVIFVSKFFKRQKLKRIFFFFFSNSFSLSRLSFLARMHATYRTCFLKPRRMLSIFSNPEKIWSAMARLLLRLNKTTKLFFFFWLRGEENLINSVVYCKKKHSNMSMFVRNKVSVFNTLSRSFSAERK